MRHPAERCLEPAGYHRHSFVGLAALAAVRDHRFVGPGVGDGSIHRKTMQRTVGGAAQGRVSPRRIFVLGAWLAVGGVLVDHRIYCATSNQESQPGPTERTEHRYIRRIRPRDDSSGISEAFKPSADDGRAKRRVVDISVPRNDDKID